MKSTRTCRLIITLLISLAAIAPTLLLGQASTQENAITENANKAPNPSNQENQSQHIDTLDSPQFNQEYLFRFTVYPPQLKRCDIQENWDGFIQFSPCAPIPLPKIDHKLDRMRILDVAMFPNHTLRLVTKQHGIYESQDHGRSWKRISQDCPPPEIIYPFEQPYLTKPILSYRYTSDRQHVVLVTSQYVYTSSDGGYSFTRQAMKGKGTFDVFRCGTIHPSDPHVILIGSAFNGIYYSKDGGASITKITEGIPGEPINRPNFKEEILDIMFDESDPNHFFVAFAFGNGFYEGWLSKQSITMLPLSAFKSYPDGDLFLNNKLAKHGDWMWFGNNRQLRQIYATSPPNTDSSRGFQLFNQFSHSPGEHLFWYKPNKQPSIKLHDQEYARTFEIDERVKGIRSTYISYSFTQRDNYPKLIKLLRTLNFNSVTLNIKDDYGQLRIPTDDPMITQVPEAVEPYINILETIKKLHEDGIYVIGRHVVFKDKRLYAYQNGKYAIKHKHTGYPLPKGPEKWVDAYSEFVWDYNIAIAKAIEAAGVDEIQFDYIRFPDVRGTDNRKYDFKREHQTQPETLTSFLKKAREAISIPISIDTFGYNSIYTYGNWIGQDITMLTEYVDAICPMFYPSHYTGGYAFGYTPQPEKRIYYTIALSCKRAIELSRGALVRPYLQGFYYKDNSDHYCVDYIGWELDGLKEAGLSDYIFWNDLHEYKILIKGIRKYYDIDGGVTTPEHLRDFPRKLPFNEMVGK